MKKKGSRIDNDARLVGWIRVERDCILWGRGGGGGWGPRYILIFPSRQCRVAVEVLQAQRLGDGSETILRNQALYLSSAHLLIGASRS